MLHQGYIKEIMMLMNFLFTLHVSLCTKCWAFEIITFDSLRYLEVMPAFVLPV